VKRRTLRSRPGELSRVLGVVIAARRTGRGFSQARLAELAELDHRTISAIETARYQVGVEVLHRIGAALGVSGSILLQEVEERLRRKATRDAAIAAAKEQHESLGV